jgi:hypothetical protein
VLLVSASAFFASAWPVPELPVFLPAAPTQETLQPYLWENMRRMCGEYAENVQRICGEYAGRKGTRRGCGKWRGGCRKGEGGRGAGSGGWNDDVSRPSRRLITASAHLTPTAASRPEIAYATDRVRVRGALLCVAVRRCAFRTPSTYRSAMAGVTGRS